MTDTPMAPDREHGIWAAVGVYGAHPNLGFACCSAHAVADAVPELLAEVDRLRARVAKLERPAVEAKRVAIRQSYMELSAQAREDRHFEGAFDVDCKLREREEQWAREDRTQ